MEPLSLPPDSRCESCGYDLRGLSVARCPECGQPFDPRQLWAAHRGERVKRPFDPAAARTLRPPTGWAVVAAVAGVAFEWSRGLPSPRADPPSMVAVAAVLWAAGTWGMQWARRRQTFAAVDVPADRRPMRGWTWVTIPVAVVVAVACLLGSAWVRIWIRFELSRSRPDAVAAQVERSHAYAPDQQVGRFSARAIRPTADGMDFRINGVYEAQLAHTTTGRPPVRWPAATPLGGGWYAMWLAG